MPWAFIIATNEPTADNRCHGYPLFAGCGGGSSIMSTSSNSTPAGTYTLTVKATSGSLSQTSQVTLKVQ